MKVFNWVFALLLVVLAAGQALAVDTVCYGVAGAQLVGGDVVLLSDYESVPGSDRNVLGLRLLNLTTGESRLLTDPVTQYPIGEIVSPDGQKVAYEPQDMLNGDTSIRIQNLINGSVDGIAIPYNEGKTLTGYRWMPDSSGLVLFINTRVDNSQSTSVAIYRPGQELDVVMTFADLANFASSEVVPSGQIYIAYRSDIGGEIISLDLASHQIAHMVTIPDLAIDRLHWNMDYTKMMIDTYSEAMGNEIWLYETSGNLIYNFQINGTGLLETQWSSFDPQTFAQVMSLDDNGYMGNFRLDIFSFGGDPTSITIQSLIDWFWFDQNHIMILSGNGNFSLLNIYDSSLTPVFTACD